MAAPTERSISENLEVIRSWMGQSANPARQSIMSVMRSVVFIGSPVLVMGFLTYFVTQAAQNGSGDMCSCPDGGVRSSISKQRLAC